LFVIVPLNKEEWIAVILISLPIIFIDETLKLISRIRNRAAYHSSELKDKKLD